MEEKIPVDKVLDDMYNPNGGMVSHAARDYYYQNYATDEEKAEMDREDEIANVTLKVIVGAFIAALAYVSIKLMFFI